MRSPRGTRNDARLASDEMRTLNRAIFVFLGLSETDVTQR